MSAICILPCAILAKAGRELYEHRKISPMYPALEIINKTNGRGEVSLMYITPCHGYFLNCPNCYPMY